MASIKLSKYECSEDLLPRIRMRCGSPADTTKWKTFSWLNPLFYLILFAGALPFLIIALILTKRMPVGVPLCREHRGHWFWRSLLVVGTLVMAVCAGFAAFIYQTNQPPGARDDLSAFLCIGSIILLIAWLILAIIVSATSIRATEITDRSITLAGVSDEFIGALEDDRERDWDDNRNRRRRYNDVRDDYDDEFDEPPPRRRARDDWDEDDDGPRRRARE